MPKIIFIATLLFVVLFLSSCDDKCSSYSDFSCEEIQKAEYNVYFYYPNRQEEYLGQAQGLE